METYNNKYVLKAITKQISVSVVGFDNSIQTRYFLVNGVLTQ